MNKGFGGHNRGGHGAGGYGGKKGGGGPSGSGSSGGYRSYHHAQDAPAEMVAAVFNSTQGLGSGVQSTPQFGYQPYPSQSAGTTNPQLAAIPPPPPPIFLPPPPPIIPGGAEQFGGMMPPHMCYPTPVGGSEATAEPQQQPRQANT